jgi:hypothetical protein
LSRGQVTGYRPQVRRERNPRAVGSMAVSP